MTKLQRYKCAFFLTALVLTFLKPLASFPHGQLARGTSVVAMYAHGNLRVSVPYRTAHAGPGRLIAEVLDADDNIVALSDNPVEVPEGDGAWTRNLQLPAKLAVEDLVWYRLIYQFTYTGESTAAIHGIVSISQVLRNPVIHVMAQQSYVSGGAAAVRVVVTDQRNQVMPWAGSVQIELLTSGQTHLLYTGKLNRRGTVEAQFHFPAGLIGNASLRYSVDTQLGAAEYTQEIRLDDTVSILLTTEKPIYQPSQTIHVRALALDKSNHAATSGRKLTFELEDSRGNKVFRKITETDAYGIASAEFGLADEVNLGTYHLRALMNGVAGPSPNQAELALRVERYVLPKFKVAVDLAGNGGHARRGYRPGDHVTGTVQANYFFGKPVDRAEVSVKASAMDVAVVEAAKSQGKTDASGAFRFDIQLPNYFAGRPLSHGAARVLIEATVKDAANHSETRGEPIMVSESPLLVTAVPEGGTLVPGLVNQVFILTSWPDGTPAQTDVRVHAPGNNYQTVSTDASGIAVIQLRDVTGSATLRVEATDRDGNRTQTSISLDSRSGADQLLLRSDKAVYHAGDRMHLKVISTRQHGSAYVDVVKAAQTVATHDVEIVDGQADLDLIATPDMAGTVEFNAYVFGGDGRPVGDHRLGFVQPADELRIETELDSPGYKPGGEARIGFRVTNARGEGVQAALGLQIVDEAVFALAEKQPGFAKVFFYLEQEAMKPRYEIHSISLPDTISSAEPAQSSQRDLAARALFAATEMVNPNDTKAEFGKDVAKTKQAEYASRYASRFRDQVKLLATTLNKIYGNHADTCDLTTLISRPQGLGAAKLLDAWGNGIRIEHSRWGAHAAYFTLRSAGPDGQFDSTDDLVQALRVSDCTVPERVRAGLAEMRGTVLDASGAVVPDANVDLKDEEYLTTRRVVSNGNGNFRFGEIEPGTYTLTVSAPGFTTWAERGISVGERASVAISNIVVQVGGTKSEVAVVAANDVVVQTDTGQVGPVLNQHMITQLSLAGRDASELIRVMPGASPNAPAAVAPQAHVRSWFPEALYINPEIITDRNGRASITVPIADSITTWRMAMLASTAHGALGSGTSSLKVFQDFFVDLDLPVTLTQGDQVSIPVAIYNYSGSRGDVRLQLQPDAWFSLADDVSAKTLAVDSGRVGGSQFTITADRIGKFKLTLTAQMTGRTGRADVVVREIEVVPNGREQSVVFNGRLDTAASHQVLFPPSAIPDASAVLVRLYPGPMSQLVEGMDSLLRMPYGCFEQTSSSTYPNVLALDYMKRTKKLTPEIHAKAEGYIATGYQRLLTFEVPGGGFSWFGSAPANKILTSYGLMEFSDMSKVYDVDPKVIQRTQQWLASQQLSDGSWKPDTNFINEGATNRYNSDVLRITAYIAWALQNTGYQGPAVEKARQFIDSHLPAGKDSQLDAYTLAVLANFAADYAKDRTLTGKVMQLLLDSRKDQGDRAWWNSEETGVYATGASAALETTGLAVQALLKTGGNSSVSTKALNYIVAGKDASGTWGTTQATIMALRALLLAAGNSGTANGVVEIDLNGKPAASLKLTAENSDLLHQFVFKGADIQSANQVEIRFSGEGSLAYQVAGRYFLPWDTRPADEALSIDVSYDRTHLAQDDIAAATATIRNNLDKTANMVMVDLGIPPGFDLLSEDLQQWQENSAGRATGKLEKFNLTATQAILYFNSIAAHDTLKIPFRLRAKYPIRARTFSSRVYEYYDPAVSSLAAPVQLVVEKR